MGVPPQLFFTTRCLQDIDKPLAPAEGEGVLLKNPIDVALSSLLGSNMGDHEKSTIFPRKILVASKGGGIFQPAIC